MTLAEFNPMYERFKQAVAWINAEYKKRGYKASVINLDSKFQSDLKEFDLKVQDPMDKAFNELTPLERAVYLDSEPGSSG